MENNFEQKIMNHYMNCRMGDSCNTCKELMEEFNQ